MSIRSVWDLTVVASFYSAGANKGRVTEKAPVTYLAVALTTPSQHSNEFVPALVDLINEEVRPYARSARPTDPRATLRARLSSASRAALGYFT